MLKRILSLLIAVFILMGAVIMTSADTISELEDERDQLASDAQIQQGIIDDKQEEIDKQQEDIDEIVLQIDALNIQIQTSRDNIADYETRIAEKEGEIKAMEQEIEDNITAFGESLRAIYMAGEVTTLEIILGASDFTDIIDKLQLVDSMNERDTQLLEELESQIEDINEETQKVGLSIRALMDEAAEAEESLPAADLRTLLHLRRCFVLHDHCFRSFGRRLDQHHPGQVWRRSHQLPGNPRSIPRNHGNQWPVDRPWLGHHHLPGNVVRRFS